MPNTHDETIQFHSDVSVEASLEALIKSIYCFPNLALVIKGHPVNPSSMQSLKNIFDESKIKDANLKKRQIYWIDDISIHQLLESCMAVFTVNSGVDSRPYCTEKRFSPSGTLIIHLYQPRLYLVVLLAMLFKRLTIALEISCYTLTSNNTLLRALNLFILGTIAMLIAKILLPF